MVDAMSEVRAGMLLVATPELLDPNFADTVVLLLDVDDDGALGVVLNRPSAVPVAAVLETGATSSPSPRCCSGRPGQHRGRARGRRCCATRTTCRSASATVDGRLGLVDLDTPVELVDRQPGRAADLRRVRRLGRRASSPPRSRRAAGTSSRARPSDVFRLDPAELWRDVLRRQPGELAWHSTRPVDPS